MENNFLSLFEKIILTGLTVSAMVSFGYEIYRRLAIVNRGVDSLPFDRVTERLWRVFREVFLHEKVIRERPFPGIMHALVFWGFLVFGVVTVPLIRLTAWCDARWK